MGIRSEHPRWRMAARAAQGWHPVPDPYQMRHTFASQTPSADENVMWVARQMGHRDWTITAKKYGRWIPSMVPDAGSKAADVWASAVAAPTTTVAPQS